MDPRRTRHRWRAGAGTTTTGLLPGRHRRLATPDRAAVGRELFARFRTPRRGGGHAHPLWIPGAAPSTRLLAEAAYATSVHGYRVDLAGEFRRPLLPAILFVELRASGLELVRFYGTGNETDGSRPDSVYRVRQTQLLLGPRRSEEHTSELQSTM